MDIAKCDFVTQDDFDDAIAVNIQSREREILDYMVAESALHSAADLLAAVGEWPEALKKHKTMRPDRVAEALDGDDLAAVNELQHRDRVVLLSRTNGQEKAKSETSLAALRGCVPAARLTAAVARVKAAPEPETPVS